MLHGGTPPREFVKHALRNASPILGTTVYPVVLLVVAALLPSGSTYDIIFDLTIILCLATVVWRIFSLNFAIARYRGSMAHPRRYYSGHCEVYVHSRW